jgi:thiamine-phosphate pyrophosphorylase
MPEHDNRCRLVLIAPEDDATDIQAALAGGDVATLILPQYERDDDAFQAYAEAIVPMAQARDVAVVIAGDTRVAGRVRADGLHIVDNAAAVGEAMEKYAPKMIVGAGSAKDRHTALEVGEERPDYIFFGRLDGDIKPDAHAKNLDLAEWWSSMIEIPCVVMGGSDIASALAVAETGADFVALRRAVFEHKDGPGAAVAEVNALLAEKAPRFE